MSTSAQAWLAFGASARGVRPPASLPRRIPETGEDVESLVPSRAATSDSSGVVFRLSSRHSATASAAATTPTPAYRRMTVPGVVSCSGFDVSDASFVVVVVSRSAERIATANSALSAPIHPSGPAYSPRSNGSTPRMASSAATRGWPHTAGVGCSARSTSASDVPSASSHPRRAYRCCTETCRKTPFSSSALTPLAPSFATAARAARTSSRTMENSSCSFGDRSISYASAASSPSSAPRGLVPATASEAARPSRDEKRRSGVDPTNAAPSSCASANWYASGSRDRRAETSANASMGSRNVNVERRASTTLRRGESELETLDVDASAFGVASPASSRVVSPTKALRESAEAAVATSSSSSTLSSTDHPMPTLPASPAFASTRVLPRAANVSPEKTPPVPSAGDPADEPKPAAIANASSSFSTAAGGASTPAARPRSSRRSRIERPLAETAPPPYPSPEAKSSM